jgi:hypothetical protein
MAGSRFTVTWDPEKMARMVALLNDPVAVERLRVEMGRQIDQMAAAIQEDARTRRNPMHRAASTHAAFRRPASDPTPSPTKERP